MVFFASVVRSTHIEHFFGIHAKYAKCDRVRQQAHHGIGSEIVVCERYEFLPNRSKWFCAVLCGSIKKNLPISGFSLLSKSQSKCGVCVNVVFSICQSCHLVVIIVLRIQISMCLRSVHISNTQFTTIFFSPLSISTLLELL